ncbi:MAG: type I restriction-modification system subunit M [Pelagimonas sp.]|jgi:type I restriction enzyme M protein|nr:type I restriction-modification system subunit M [Pelagimonas sp.]
MAQDRRQSDLDFAADLFKAADKMRGGLEPSEYKHVALGLIFLKYISEAFQAKHEELALDDYADPEDPEEYLAENVFWVPESARWSHIQNNAKTSDIGKIIDDAMEAIEAEPTNETLKGVLPKNYARPTLDKTMLGELVDLFSNIKMHDRADRARDLLGRVYEYFISGFASAEGKRGGEFFTPRSVVRTLVEMLEPYQGRVYDPCCGSGGMFIQSEKFIEDHGGNPLNLSVYGQEINHTTWRLAKMNLAVHGIDAAIEWDSAGSFHKDAHPGLKADYILANPPFNISDWGGDRLTEDDRWQYGIPPKGNANFAWIQHIIHHLAPRGHAGVVLANGSMSSQTSGEGEIRKRLIEPTFDEDGKQTGGDVVDCMVALPGQLFYSTQIPVCLWILSRDKSANGLRDRRGQVLFIDARNMGHMVDRVRREFSDEDIEKIAGTYRRWRAKPETLEENEWKAYADEPGFCKSEGLETIRKFDHVLTPGRYVGAADEEGDGVPFEEKFASLTGILNDQFEQSRSLEDAITAGIARVTKNA